MSLFFQKLLSSNLQILENFCIMLIRPPDRLHCLHVDFDIGTSSSVSDIASLVTPLTSCHNVVFTCDFHAIIIRKMNLNYI